jgi:hypothetical protein
MNKKEANVYKKITTHVLQEMKLKGEKIAMLTAYDFSMAGLLDQAGIDVILVGDSASNVMAGHTTTLPITLDQMIYHASSVMRAVKRALVVVDLPFGTYQGNSKEALNTAIAIMKLSGANAAMGGVDIIVFTGGIGENDCDTRAKVIEGLEFLGVDFDFELNKGLRGKEVVLTSPSSKVKVLVVPTNEEMMIAKDTYNIVTGN